MTMTIEWHDAKKELPAKSGSYLVKTRAHCATLEYSAKYRVFNAYDEQTKLDAWRNAIDVKYWAEMPEFPDEVTDNGEF